MTKNSLENIGEILQPQITSGNNEILIENGVQDILINILGNDFESLIKNKNVYLSTALYLVYWYNRTKNNDRNNSEARENAYSYFGSENKALVDILLSNTELGDLAKKHVEGNVLSQATVDLVIQNDLGEILTLERKFFPKGKALIGGFLLDEDHDNELEISGSVFAALRVAGTKILESENTEYGESNDEKGSFYYVQDKKSNSRVKIYMIDQKGYHYKDKVHSMVKASDPRHMVDSTAFSMHFDQGATITDSLTWAYKKEILNLENGESDLAFGHHREMIDAVTAETTAIDIENISHHKWVRGIIQKPLENYKNIKDRFEKNNNDAETPCPELLPTVKKMMDDLFSDEINTLCSEQSFALGQRHIIMNDLMHCATESDKICPYRSTISAMFKVIEFFDIHERIKKGFYDSWETCDFVEQDPSKQQYAYFFRTKYKNHLDQILARFPDEIVIPTYEHTGATDLMKIRGIPMRFIGLSNTFLYVDEFYQSPVEFLLHDADHSLRMAYEDEKYCEEHNMPREELIQKSIEFSNNYLKDIALSSSDSNEEKEIKKLKKILLFEVTHEDSKPFMKDVIQRALQTEEGADIHRETISINSESGMYERSHSIAGQGGVSPLAFALHKLQHGFFDQVDNQIPQIVNPRFRTAEYVARAAYEILKDLDTAALEGVPIDETGNISYDWILKRTCSKSPRKVHHTEFRDPAIAEYGDGTDS